MTIQDIFQLLSNPLFFTGLALFVFVICAIVLAWHYGYNAGLRFSLAVIDEISHTRASTTAYPDYYGDPWTEGLTAESKENRIDTL